MAGGVWAHALVETSNALAGNPPNRCEPPGYVCAEMQSDGRRLILTSGVDYGPVMHPLIFMKCACFITVPCCTIPADRRR
jgi:hypothetical protein